MESCSPEEPPSTSVPLWSFMSFTIFAQKKWNPGIWDKLITYNLEWGLIHIEVYTFIDRCLSVTILQESALWFHCHKVRGVVGADIWLFFYISQFPFSFTSFTYTFKDQTCFCVPTELNPYTMSAQTWPQCTHLTSVLHILYYCLGWCDSWQSH